MFFACVVLLIGARRCMHRVALCLPAINAKDLVTALVPKCASECKTKWMSCTAFCRFVACLQSTRAVHVMRFDDHGAAQKVKNISHGITTARILRLVDGGVSIRNTHGRGRPRHTAYGCIYYALRRDVYRICMTRWHASKPSYGV